MSQEAGQEVWYSHLFKNFPQFVVIHTVKGFGIVNKAEVIKNTHKKCTKKIFMTQIIMMVCSLT